MEKIIVTLKKEEALEIFGGEKKWRMIDGEWIEVWLGNESSK
ncbi:MAG: hypothetical protein ACRC8J_02400 [Phocaeicola sp.]